jgi:hypothetical protein
MTDLRRQAIGRECQVRLPGCNTGPCCVAHFRLSGVSGLGMKSPDLLGAWACHNCHTKVDTTHRGDPDVQLDFAKAVLRTQAVLIREGIIHW